jgi:hypothetical protein
MKRSLKCIDVLVDIVSAMKRHGMVVSVITVGLERTKGESRQALGEERRETVKEWLSVIVNLMILGMGLKLYTEYMKDRRIEGRMK